MESVALYGLLGMWEVGAFVVLEAPGVFNSEFVCP